MDELMQKIADGAVTLYDEGWRKNDWAKLIREYHMTDDEAAVYCMALEMLEEMDADSKED